MLQMGLGDVEGLTHDHVAVARACQARAVRVNAAKVSRTATKG